MHKFLHFYDKKDITINKIVEKQVSTNLSNLSKFVSQLVDSENIDMFYYNLSESKNILVINKINNKDIDSLVEFADFNNFILSIDIDLFNNQTKNLGFDFNNDFSYIKERIIRYPKIQEKLIQTNNLLYKSVDLSSRFSIQSNEYKKEWYLTYQNLINSIEYKEKVKKEQPLFFSRNKQQSELDSRVGFAIVGKAKVGKDSVA